MSYVESYNSPGGPPKGSKRYKRFLGALPAMAAERRLVVTATVAVTVTVTFAGTVAVAVALTGTITGAFTVAVTVDVISCQAGCQNALSARSEASANFQPCPSI